MKSLEYAEILEAITNLNNCLCPMIKEDNLSAASKLFKEFGNTIRKFKPKIDRKKVLSNIPDDLFVEIIGAAFYDSDYEAISLYIEFAGKEDLIESTLNITSNLSDSRFSKVLIKASREWDTFIDFYYL